MGIEEKLMETTVIVPMRSGSKGIKNKNIKTFLGLPLYFWTVKKLLHLFNIGKISKVIVSSDSDWYLEKVKISFGKLFNEGLILSKRNDDLGTDFTTTEEVCLYLLNKHNIYDGILGIVEVTSPLIPINSLALMFDSINEYIDSSFIVYKDIGQFWKCNNSTNEWEKQYSNRKMRQEEGSPLFREVGAWAIKIDRFLKDKDRIVYPTSPIIIDKEYGISINDQNEFNYAEKLMEELSPQIYSNCGLYE